MAGTDRLPNTKETWTTEYINKLIYLRDSGRSWAHIASTLKMCPNICTNMYRKYTTAEHRHQLKIQMRKPSTLTDSLKGIVSTIESDIPGILINAQTAIELYNMIVAASNISSAARAEAKRYILQAITSAALHQDQVSLESMLSKVNIPLKDFRAYDLV